MMEAFKNQTKVVVIKSLSVHRGNPASKMDLSFVEVTEGNVCLNK